MFETWKTKQVEKLACLDLTIDNEKKKQFNNNIYNISITELRLITLILKVGHSGMLNRWDVSQIYLFNYFIFD